MKDKSRTHYHPFQHIFLYITEKCQLRCKHCYMGDRLIRKLSMSTDQIYYYLTFFYNIGARNLTILGGEPTLHPDFESIVPLAHSIGYSIINIDTNGLNIDKILNLNNNSINYIRVSLDGPIAELHDFIRGDGNFDRTIVNIKQLAKLNYRVAITCTITRHNLESAPGFLDLAEKYGIKLLNFHVLSEEGYGKNLANLSLDQNEWLEFCHYLEKVKNQYKISIWYPPTWTTKDRIQKFVSEGYKGCMGITLDRLSVFPDGTCYVCSVLLDKQINYGVIDKDGFHINRKDNEFELFANSFYGIKYACYSGCPAEKFLAISRQAKFNDEFISLCRCWKSQI